MTGQQVYPHDLSHSVSANTGSSSPESEERAVEERHRVEQIHVGFESGVSDPTNVGVRFRTGTGTVIFPRDDETDFFTAEADYTGRFAVFHDFGAGETMTAEFFNNDAAARHVNLVAVVRLLGEGRP